MKHRKPFSYSAWRLCKLEWFSNPWCLCMRKYPKREDKLFKEGKKKLYEELDILEIIKKLRVNQFTSDLALTQTQRDLVNFHQDYKIMCSDDFSSDDDYNEYVQRPRDGERRKSQAQNLEEQVNNQKQANRVMNAISTLKPSRDRKDRLTYCRIIDEDFEDDTRSAYSKNVAPQRRHRALAAQPGAQDVDGVIRHFGDAEHRS